MKYAPAVNTKFYENGEVREFPGNTFLCSIDKNISLMQEIEFAQNTLKGMKCAHKFAFLPLSSMHMTIFEGLCDQVRKPELWSNKFAIDTAIEETTDFIEKELQNVQALGGFEMVFNSVIYSPNGAISIRIKPKSEDVHQKIIQCREELSQATGIRLSDSDDYHFHISLNYRILELNKQDEDEMQQTIEKTEKYLDENFGTLVHGPVEFCRFKNMFVFEPVKLLT